MKKVLAVALILALTVALLAGCGGKTAAPSGTSSNPQTSTNNKPSESTGSSTKPAENTEKTEPAPAAEKVEWKFSTAAREGSQTVIYFQKLVDRVSEETNGNFTIHFYTSGTLGTDKEVMESVETGILEMCTCTNSTLSKFAPVAGGLVMPYLVSDWDSLKQLLQAQSVIDVVGNELDPLGVFPISMYSTGFRMFVNDKKPIYKMEDMEGIKLRVAESDVYIAIFNALGAYPIGLANSEIITSLQQGVIDAVENTPDTNYSDGIYEFCKYISGTNHTFSSSSIIVNKDAFAKLPAEYQEVLRNACQEYSAELVAASEEQASHYLDLLVQNGMEYNEIAPEELKRMSDVCREKVWAQFADQYKTLTDAVVAAIG